MPPRQIAVPRPNPRDPLGNSGISPLAEISLLQVLIGTPAGGAFKVKVCSHLRRRKPYKRLNLYAYPAGADFCSCKSQQNTLGALPQDPCRWLCWIRIDFRLPPKINPYCAQNRSQGSHGRSCPFPPPPFPRRERGPDGRAIRNRQQRSRGVRACKNRKAADSWLWLAGLSVCTEMEGVPLPRSGGGREGADALRHLISTV